MDTNSAQVELEDWLHRNNLVVPPLPTTLTHLLRSHSKCVFTSRTEVPDPYNHHEYIQEALEPALADYVLVAHAGHGVNSYAIPYCVAWSGMRILLQLAWGGAYMDNDACGERIRGTFNRLHVLWPALAARDRTNASLLVAYSDFYGGLLARDGVESDRWRSGAGSGILRAFEHLHGELGLEPE